MLKQRVLTALVIAPLVIAAVFLMPPLWFGGLVSVIMGLAAWEWARLAGCRRPPVRLAYALIVAASCLGMTLFQREWLWLWLAVPFWLLALLWLVRPAVQPAVGLSLLFGLIFLLATCLGLILLQMQDPWLVVLLLGLVAAADVGAYFAGRRFGRHKLAPAISPGKTWEGVAGGMLLAALVAVVATYLLGARPLPAMILVCMLVALLSVGGDLVESMLKRKAGLKDSGRLLPGHGGLLDRMDSLLVATPVFVLGIGLLVEFA